MCSFKRYLLPFCYVSTHGDSVTNKLENRIRKMIFGCGICQWGINNCMSRRGGSGWTRRGLCYSMTRGGGGQMEARERNQLCGDPSMPCGENQARRALRQSGAWRVLGREQIQFSWCVRNEMRLVRSIPSFLVCVRFLIIFHGGYRIINKCFMLGFGH